MLRNSSFILRSFVLAGLAVLAVLPLTGCKEKSKMPASRLEFLEIDIAETKASIEKDEARYLEERKRLEEAGDKNEIRILDLKNKGRLETEKRYLKVKEKELEKLRKEQGAGSAE